MSKTTALHSQHLDLKARMVPYAGWDMPVSYPLGTVGEVKACRSFVGIFDVSHMGEVRVQGHAARDFLQFLTSNNIDKLEDGDAQYSMLLNPSGGVEDDIIVYRRSHDDFLIVVNAGCHDKDIEWIVQQSRTFDVKVTDTSQETSLIAVQGPNAVAMVSENTSTDVESMERFTFIDGQFADSFVTFSRSGYTGEDGFEIFCGWSDAPKIWDALVNAGAVPCGLAARDVLRLEAAYPLYGHELSELHTPFESGTGWAVKMNKGEFIGRDALLKQKEAGVAERLVGIKMTEPFNAIPRDGYSIYEANSDGPIGNITSGTLSPMLGIGIAMARLRVEFLSVGTLLIVDIRGRKAQAKVAALPFYRNGV